LKFVAGRKEIIAIKFVYSKNHRIYVRGILAVRTKYGVFSVRNGGAYSDNCLLLAKIEGCTKFVDTIRRSEMVFHS